MQFNLSSIQGFKFSFEQDRDEFFECELENLEMKYQGRWIKKFQVYFLLVCLINV